VVRNNLKIAWRNLLKSMTYSFINIAGLAADMAVAMIIGLWISDELSANRQFKNYDSVYQVM
jgi:putative ABC transport system permease protein